MKRFSFIFVCSIGGLYLLLHLVLASSPVQKRVLDEVRQALSTFGFDLEIESIEFSAFTPKIYLNRVTLKTTAQSKIPLPEPLAIDKIKIQFQPLALLYDQIIIDEAILFHPKIYVPKADELYVQVKKLIEEKSKMMVQGGRFAVVFKKIGIVDALFNVVSEDPSFSIRSRSLSAFLQQNANQQQTVTVESSNLEIDRGKLKLRLTKTDVDVDMTLKSLRVNRGIVEGEGIEVNIKGATSLPLKVGKEPDSVHLSYDVKIAVALLNQIAELSLPKLEGNFSSSGTMQMANGSYQGNGKVGYDAVSVDDYRVGTGSFEYTLNDKRLNLSALNLHYGDGDLSSKHVSVDFKEGAPISGELALHGIRLEGILDSVKSPHSPVQMTLDGDLKFNGRLLKSFGIDTDINAKFTHLNVLNDGKKPVDAENSIINVKDGELAGKLRFSTDKMSFKTVVATLDGKAEVEGYLGFDNDAEIRVNAQSLSLTKLAHIADVRLGGKTNLVATVDVKAGHPQISGGFDIAQAEIADIVLGNVKGNAFYENELLSFENLELNALDPIHANGFLDFHPTKNHYKFQVNVRRSAINQIFGIFEKQKLGFPQPKGGEVGARVTIEGGHDLDGIDVTASGQARNFTWYDEKWLNSTFSLRYRPKFVEINRTMLVKRSGGLEVRGHFAGKQSSLTLISHGLRLEELSYIGKAPMIGELQGQVRLEGDLAHPRGQGDVRLTKASYRGTSIPDSTVRIKTEGNQTEFAANIMGEGLKARLVRVLDLAKGNRETSELLLYFRDFDFAPLLSLSLGKDIPPLSGLVGTGDLSLNGILNDWENVSGSGTISDLKIGLRGTPMKNEGPLYIKVTDGSVKVDRFRLIGSDSQLSVEYLYQPGKMVNASIDGKIDLQYLQPFIPGLEYGSGKVSAGVRVSGVPTSFDMLGNVTLEDGSFRLAGLQDEFRSVQLQLSLSQDRINVDRFESQLGGGSLSVSGDVRINKFRALRPNLALIANRVTVKTQDYLTTKVSGDFFIRGDSTPYQFGGKCKILEARLSDFNIKETERTEERSPLFNFDVKCDAKDKLLVETDVMNAEFKGDFHLVGNTDSVGLLGNAEGMHGSVFFKETKFNLESATVRFEDEKKIVPRFNVAGRALVKEQTAPPQQEYDVSLQVLGIPTDYKIRLNSTPALTEADLKSLLVIGVTSRSHDGNYLDLGTTIVGQTPLQSKIQSELGVNIKVGTAASTAANTAVPNTSTLTSTTDTTVPTVKIQKDVTKQTRVSVSNTWDQVPLKEFKIEHMLDDNFTLNGTRTDKNRGPTTDPLPSYGIDLRYHFNFE